MGRVAKVGAASLQCGAAMGGEYGSDEEGGPFAGGSSHNQTDASAPAKSLRFGLLELGIFMALWVVVIVGLKVYTRRAKRSSKSAPLPAV